MAAQRRKTDIAKELESFLDHNQRTISDDTFDALEDIAETVDDMADSLHDEIDDLKTRITELEEQIEILEAGE